eukprot:1577302-Rhodomonas_salina.2
MSKSGLCPCGPGDHGALGDSSCSGTGVSGCWSSFASSVAADAFLLLAQPQHIIGKPRAQSQEDNGREGQSQVGQHMREWEGGNGRQKEKEYRWAARCLNAAMMSCVVHDMPFWRTVARGCSATLRDQAIVGGE